MRMYICSVLLTLIFVPKNSVFCQSNSPASCTGFEIQENKTDLKTALHALGKEDLLFKTYACGASSGYVIQLYLFKKAGLAITSKTGLVDKIELLDTLQLPHYDDGADVLLTPAFQNIINLFGTPGQTLEAGTTTALIYPDRGTRFVIDNTTKKLVKLILL